MVKKRKPTMKFEAHIETTVFDNDIHNNSRLHKLRNQSNKILEEAAEVFAAVQTYENFVIADDVEQVEKKWDVLDEMADVIQSVLNLAYKMDFDSFDIEEAMIRCEMRNKQRGRC